MTRVVAAPDKFRGTATAAQAASAIVRAATAAGFEARACPMSDGGEGFVDVMDGAVRRVEVRGPLGELVVASWKMQPDGTAIVESAEAIGRGRLVHPRGDEPVRASTHGVGDLVATAIASGARRVVVGCGGTATSDGGAGCVEVLEQLGVVRVPIVVACDVQIRFLDAARRFGPQKGATAAQVRQLDARLAACAAGYLERFGVDVTTLDGSGAGGGLAGGLLALGATATGGAAFVAEQAGLSTALAGASLVVTGEGAIDDGTLDGKVVAEVLARSAGLPALVVAGAVDDAVVARLAATREGPVIVTELSSDPDASTEDAIFESVAAFLASAEGAGQLAGA